MAKVTLDTNEFKTIIKTFSKINSYSFRKTNVVGLTFDPHFRMVSKSDQSILISQPEVEVCGEPSGPYFFVPDILNTLPLPSPKTTISWESASGPLSLVNGNFKTQLSIATRQPDYGGFGSITDKVIIPVSVLAAITKYLSIPFAYYKSKKDFLPITLRSKNGKLEALADDSYSLGKIETDVDIPFELDVKVPKFLLDCLYKQVALDSDGKTHLGIDGYKTYLSNGSVKTLGLSLNDQTNDFDAIVPKPTDFLTSCSFVPQQLQTATQFLCGLIPEKDVSGAVITANFSDILMLKVSHQMGTGNIDTVEGVEDIYNENSLKQVTINMHPKALFEFTKLLQKTDKAKMSANQKCVFYEADEEFPWGKVKIKYLFPTVQ